MKQILKTCTVLCLMLSLCAGALAATVGYEGGAQEFVFLPGEDLFENFKNLLPGDEVTQTIEVRNQSGEKVRLFLRAEPVSEADRALLEQLSLSVTCRDEEIFDAAASETAQLTKNTLLGTFRSGGGTQLEVTLSVPKDMGSAFMGASGVVPWTFVAEEIPDDGTPHTGDWYQSGVWIGAAVLLMALIAALLIAQLRRRGKE